MEILFGIISGIISSLGMGGGTILIMLFIIFKNIDQHLVQGTNMVFFIPTSIISIIINRNKINYNMSLKIIASGILGAVIGSLLSFKINSESLKKYFGIFLIVIAFFEIFSLFKQYIFKQKENNN